MTIGALFESQFMNEIVDADLHRFLDHAIDFHHPRPDRQRLRGCRDRFRGAELVEIIVVAIDLLVGDRPVERIFLIALGGIKVRTRIGQFGGVGNTLCLCGIGHHRERAGATSQKIAATENQMLGRGEAVGYFPAAAANNVHRQNPPESPSRGKSRAAHLQVTLLREEAGRRVGFYGLSQLSATRPCAVCGIPAPFTRARRRLRKSALGIGFANR